MTPAELSWTVLSTVRRAVAAEELRVAVPEKVVVQRPPRPGCGDYATNVALQLAGAAGRSAYEVAEILAVRLAKEPGIAQVEIAGAGFLNITLSARAYADVVRQVREQGRDYGRGDGLAGEAVTVVPEPPYAVRATLVAEVVNRLLRAAGAAPGGRRESLIAAEPVVHAAEPAEPAERVEPAGLARPAHPAVRSAPGGPAEQAHSAVPAALAHSADPAGAPVHVGLGPGTVESGAAAAEAHPADWAAASAPAEQAHSAVPAALAHSADPAGAPVHVGPGSGTVGIRAPAAEAHPADWAAASVPAEQAHSAVQAALAHSAHPGAPAHPGLGPGPAEPAAPAGETHPANRAGPVHHVAPAAPATVHHSAPAAPVHPAATAAPVHHVASAAPAATALGPDAARWALLRPPVDDVPRVTPALLDQREANPLFRVRYAHSRTRALLRNAHDLGVRVETGAKDPYRHPAETELLGLIADFPRVVETAARRRAPDRLARHLERLADAYLRFQDECPVLPKGDEKPSAVHAARVRLADATGIVLADGLHLLGISAPDHL